ncbi:MAG: PP2C family protein-serine/threonine phosphatase [Planctomycetota bacterium]|nr:PP2C family protein-serine/threonine phosphatase [Planctomycetota bacterium]MDA1179732.1 PP2C family protein-serine/threonine phosphatase [Planctomycetota bacterium]
MSDEIETSPMSHHVRQLEAELTNTESQPHVGHHLTKGELELAVRIHESMLPKPVQHPNIDVAVRYLPVSGLGGDYCQVLFFNDATCCISICDVTGHGVGPALLATRVSSEVRRLTYENKMPREILEGLNAFLVNHFGDTGMQVSFFAARVDLDQQTIAYSGGGHPGPLLLHQENGTQRIERLTSQNMLLGVSEQCMGAEPEHTVSVVPGDRLLFYTDGLTETRTTEDKLLGETGLGNIARNLCVENVYEAVECIVDRVAQCRRGPQTDDITLLMLEMK